MIRQKKYLIGFFVWFQLYGKNYYQPEHYVSKRMLEKLALPTIKEELPRLHASHAHMLPEEAETEYLKVFTAFFYELPCTVQ